MNMHYFRLAIRHFGMGSTLKLFLSRRMLQKWFSYPRWTTVLKLKNFDHPVHYRHGTSDKQVVEDVLLYAQYQGASSLHGVSLIVDAGSNIGTSAIYFLRAYPNARVIAIEPDPDNWLVLCKNMAPYGARVLCLQAALWHCEDQLMLEKGAYRDGDAWSTMTTPQTLGCVPRAQLVNAITVPQILQRYSDGIIDVLKIDIEASEKYLFDQSAQEWLRNVRMVVIELHDDNCTHAFMHAISAIGGDITRDGELTIWRNPGIG
jgi:FkbM family methyltransferase